MAKATYSVEINGKMVEFDDATKALAAHSAEADRLRGELAEARRAKQAAASRAVTVKVLPLGETGEYKGTITQRKGNIGIYGLNQMPLTLYAAQWPALLAVLPVVGATIRENASSGKLSFRDEADKARAMGFPVSRAEWHAFADSIPE